MSDYIPTFEEKNENQIIQKIDEFEEQIRTLNGLTKKYDKLKKEIKENMLKKAKDSLATQLKWITPKGIKVTLSVGTKAEYETKEVEEFNIIKFMEEEPEMYEKYLEKKTREVVTKTGSNDRLVVTLPKEEENE